MTAVLEEVLTIARDRGFLGPGDVAFHVEHASRYAAVLSRAGVSPDGRVLDLGSGAGLPGLVLAVRMPELRVTLLDSNLRRCDHLVEAVDALGASDRVEVVRERAESAGHDPLRRGRYDAVVTRSFGAPAVTAECAAPFLRPHGVLVVSDPRDGTDRWPSDGLARLGMEPTGAGIEDDTAHLRVIRQETRCPPEFPRGDGVPKKRPLF